ncbi:hypothetical protein E2320_018397, partial [Naja naja]
SRAPPNHSLAALVPAPCFLLLPLICLPACPDSSLDCIIFGPAAPAPGLLAVSAVGACIRSLVIHEHCYWLLPCAHLTPPVGFNNAAGKAWDPCELGSESHGHLERLPLSTEKDCNLIPFTLQKPLPSRLVSQHLFSAYRRSHILMVIAEGKSEGEKLGRREKRPPSQPAGLSAIAAVPLYGGGARHLFSRPAVMAKEVPPPGVLTLAAIQSSASCSRSPSVTCVSSGVMWEGLQKASPSSPLDSSPGNSVCSPRTGRKREKEREKGKKRERKREKGR